MSDLTIDQKSVINIDDCIKQLQNGDTVDWERYSVTPILRSIIEQLANQEGELE